MASPRLVKFCIPALLPLAVGCSHFSPAKSLDRMQSATPDKRFKGINELAAHKIGRQPPYPTDYAQIAKTDPDYLIRATAIRALNRCRLKEATPLFITALSDDSSKVRLEGAKALVNLPDDNAIVPLVGLLNKTDEDKDVRIAAAAALSHYKRLDVARALAANLSEREFGVAWQSRRTLRSMTGKDFAFSEPAWLDYFVGPAKPFG